jgi:hypothetical protein
MKHQEVWDLFTRILTNLSADEEHDLRHPDYVMDIPQSGERIRGRDRMREMQRAYEAPPTNIRLRRVVGSGDVWVAEGSGDWSGRTYFVVNVVEFRDGKILHETRYYADPFPAPEWRAPYAEEIAP